mgnify:CR=1 FL=1
MYTSEVIYTIKDSQLANNNERLEIRENGDMVEITFVNDDISISRPNRSFEIPYTILTDLMQVFHEIRKNNFDERDER